MGETATLEGTDICSVVVICLELVVVDFSPVCHVLAYLLFGQQHLLSDQLETMNQGQ